MAATILDGRALAAELRDELGTRAAALRARGVAPRLVVMLVGDDPPSHAYARQIANAGTKCGIDVATETLPSGASEKDVTARLRALGEDELVHGIILQQPLPPHLGARRIVEAIPAQKDVDGANPLNLGRLAANAGTALVPATPAAVMLLLERSARPLRGARACVVGRSSVVGLPVALLLVARDATVTVAHSKTADLPARTREADILVVAMGRPGAIGAEHVKPGATVIDVGTTYVNGSVRGDVDAGTVAPLAGELTPVPGGVGPVTNVALLRNVVSVAEATP
ncbi:MAG TPA: bifunctional 5,10-methylenetetrahydrofolate dehydrogenase/5,10-methenyltetrahydrofolate cyclohydrolase [Candidatus Baltobacteraceae bacterium]|nr:bifunctional 5,10-methylenetetrahydrofolate dehydrogenase/5,10-methenyltetrahydrofolate cyclohydrolase [Candidatus Baltobacteraceae bacterium]